MADVAMEQPLQPGTHTQTHSAQPLPLPSPQQLVAKPATPQQPQQAQLITPLPPMRVAPQAPSTHKPDTQGPAKDMREVWDETEKKFWEKFRDEQEAQHVDAQIEHERSRTQLRARLNERTARYAHLTEIQARLARELAQVDRDLARARSERDSAADELSSHEQDYRKELHKRVERRDQLHRSMSSFFREKRGDEPIRESKPSTHTASHPSPQPRALSHHHVPLPGMGKRHPSPPVAYRRISEADKVADIVDGDGQVVAPLRRIEPWNQYVRAIQGMPAQRPIRLRRDRRFDEQTVAGIYERSEPKGIKWLSCMIQATGRVQSKRCQACDNGQGAFEECVIVGGDLFPKCGNCEWNRQGCHGASGEWQVGPRPQYHSRDHRPASLPVHPRPHGESAAPIPPETDWNAHLTVARLAVDYARKSALTSATADTDPSKGPQVSKTRQALPNGQPQILAAKEPYQMPTPRAEPREFASYNGYPIGNGFTPANMRSRHHSHDMTPRVMSGNASSQPLRHLTPKEQYAEFAGDQPLEEITRDNLILKNNGSIYTYPDLMVGVPMEKIDENHPYWEPGWKDVKAEIQRQKELWQTKLQNTIEAEQRGEKTGSARYQIGRQVNRGTRILEFLETGEIHPYQLVRKRYINASKGGICSYDTLFRLCETIVELSKFKLDISPVDWIRHRLYEIQQREGENFNMPKTVHDFYHDPKLSALRTKHGFKNIGRPSGMRMGPGSAHRGGSVLGKKRKSGLGMHDFSGTIMSQSPISRQGSAPPEPTGQESAFFSGSPRASKRSKPSSPTSVGSNVNDVLNWDDASDTDSYSGAPILDTDFRLHQVKTRLYTSGDGITQYWTWLGEGEDQGNKKFEYQVLKDMDPEAKEAEWATLRSPINFNLALDEIEQVAWNLDSLRVQLIMKTDASATHGEDGKPRGDVLASFKRETTMKRFLWFCRESGKEMVEETADVLNQLWDEMKSEQLSEKEEDPSNTNSIQGSVDGDVDMETRSPISAS